MTTKLANISVRVILYLLIFYVGSVRSFDYKDEIAQGTCTSILTDANPDHVYAVRRTCSDAGGSCSDVCSKIGKKCYNALHVYTAKILGITETGKEGLRAYKYNQCSSKGCGPNFCCCSNNEHPLPNPNAFKDKIAQATCTAILPGSANHVYAVRRQCTYSTSTTCETVCSNLSKTCFNSLHVYSASPLDNTETGKEGLHTYRYNSCKKYGCGPNFCCCSAK